MEEDLDVEDSLEEYENNLKYAEITAEVAEQIIWEI